MTSKYFPNGSLRCLLLIITYFSSGCLISFSQDIDPPQIPEPVTDVTLFEESVPGRVRLSWNAPETDTEGNPISPFDLTYMVYSPSDDGILYPVTDTPIISRTILRQVCGPEEKSTAQFYVLSLLNGTPAERMTESRKIAVGVSEPLPYYNGFTPADLAREIIYTESDDNNRGLLTIVEQQSSSFPSGDDDNYYALAEQNTLYTSMDVYTGKINLSQVENPELHIKYYKWGSDDANTIGISGLCEDGEIIEIASIDKRNGKNGWNTYICPLNKLKHHKPQIILTFNFTSYLSTPFDSLAIYDLYNGIDAIETENEIEVSYHSGDTCISGLSTEDQWNIYDISGTHIISGHGNANLSLNPGLYIISVNMSSNRIINKKVKISVPLR
ncbi:MAG: hypothetical protein K2M03_03860 [Muribaculaceae bacterium]|nr:hypothetical protein [Muribaculaceae bacterium]